MKVQNKLKVFLSSKCGDDIFNEIRAKTKLVLENTGLYKVYTFEDGTASTLPVEDSYLVELDDSHVCLFFIDENSDLPKGVAKEVKRAIDNESKSLFIFLKGTKHIETKEQIRDKGFCRYREINTIEDFIEKGCESVLDDLVTIYREYSRGRLLSKGKKELEIDLGFTNESNYKLTKVFFKGFSKTYKFFDNYVLGDDDLRKKGDRTTSEFDNLTIKILPTFIENEGLNLEALELLKIKLNEAFPAISDIRSKRLEIIKQYYSGAIDESCKLVEELYDKIRDDNNIPQWIKDDILIDYRNIQISILNMRPGDRFPKKDANKEVVELPHRLSYPDIDRSNSDFYKDIVTDIKKSNYVNMNMVSVGRDQLIDDISKIADVGITALYYGSLTQLWQLQYLLKALFLRLSEKYTNIWFKKQLLKLHILHPEKDSKNIISRYDYIWGHCSQTEIGGMLPKIFSARYSQRKATLKATMEHLGNFLSDKDFSFLEDEFFKYIEEEGVSFYLFQEILPWIRFVPMRISTKRVILFLKKCYNKQPQDYMSEHFMKTMSELNYDFVSKEDISFIQDMILCFFKYESKTKNLEQSNNLLIKIGMVYPNLNEWLMENIKQYYPQFLTIYNLNIQDNCFEDVQFMIRQELSAVDAMIKNSNSADSHNLGENHFEFIYKLLKVTNGLSKEIAYEMTSKLKEVLLHNRFLLMEKLSALKCLCLIASRNIVSKEVIQDILRDNLFLEGYDDCLFGANITKTTLSACGRIILLICNANDNVLMLTDLHLLDDNDKQQVMHLIYDCYNFDSKNKVAIGIILQFIINCAENDNREIYYLALKKIAWLLNTKFKPIVEPILLRMIRQQNYVKRLAVLRVCRETNIPNASLKKIIEYCSDDNHFVVQAMVKKLESDVKIS